MFRLLSTLEQQAERNLLYRYNPASRLTHHAGKTPTDALSPANGRIAPLLRNCNAKIRQQKGALSEKCTQVYKSAHKGTQMLTSITPTTESECVSLRAGTFAF